MRSIASEKDHEYEYYLDNVEDVKIEAYDDIGNEGDEIYLQVEIADDADLKVIGQYEIPPMFWIGIVVLIVGVLIITIIGIAIYVNKLPTIRTKFTINRYLFTTTLTISNLL